MLFTELADIVKDIAAIANALSNPQPVDEDTSSERMTDENSQLKL